MTSSSEQEGWDPELGEGQWAAERTGFSPRDVGMERDCRPQSSRFGFSCLDGGGIHTSEKQKEARGLEERGEHEVIVAESGRASLRKVGGLLAGSMGRPLL